jgi:hypothetical protein
MKLLTLISTLTLCLSPLLSQQWQGRTMQWMRSGSRVFSSPELRIYLDSLGADPTGAMPSDDAMTQALAIAQGEGATIVLGAGTYMFRRTVMIPSNTTIQGQGANATTLMFNDIGETDCIRIQGGMTRALYPLVQPLKRGDSLLYFDGGVMEPGALLRIVMNDSDYVYSDWARGSVGQVVEVRSSIGQATMLDTPLRLDVAMARNPRCIRLIPAEKIRVRCLAIERTDSTAQQTANIRIQYARDVVIDGVRSRNTNFGHIVIEASARVTVTRCDIAESFGYGGGGRGYGVVCQFTASDCRIEDNIFSDLRHSMLLQAGANGNVFAYNSSVNARWTEFPNDAAGDVVFHGNWVFGNLVEGNDVCHIVVDNSHGANGWFNTVLRNRSREYGLFMGASPYADSTTIMGNEITNAGLFKGLFITGGAGLVNIGNIVKGKLTPPQLSIVPPASFLYSSRPSSYQGTIWPPHGAADPSQRDTIPARMRMLVSKQTCPCEADIPTTVAERGPSTPNFDGVNQVLVYDVQGRLVFDGSVQKYRSWNHDHLVISQHTANGTMLVLMR